ncbi:MAG: hypothetical protein QME62_03795 [Armatimonadota bacterium]|nr:hypothetical protein [Armatimonadota bacterium]
MTTKIHPKTNAETPISRKQMHTNVMEMIADVLLACCADRDPGCPTYTERQLLRKCRKSSLPEGFVLGAADVDSSALMDAEISSIIRHTKMSPSEEQAWRLHAVGYNFTEIANQMGVSQPTAVRFVRSAIRRVNAARAKYEGLSSIYKQETKKYIYRKPAHCNERHCAKLGYCRFALRGKSIFDDSTM